MTEYPLTVAEFMEQIRPEIERQVDELIEAQPDPHLRQAMIRQRQEIIERIVDKTEIANLRHRLAEAKARFAPRAPADVLH
jgi:hypothetical protein